METHNLAGEIHGRGSLAMETNNQDVGLLPW